MLVAIGLGNMPIAGSCSLALAAAAHRPAADSDASVRPVMWGELPEMGNDEVGHCCFTVKLKWGGCTLVSIPRHCDAGCEVDFRSLYWQLFLGFTILGLRLTMLFDFIMVLIYLV